MERHRDLRNWTCQAVGLDLFVSRASSHSQYGWITLAVGGICILSWKHGEGHSNEFFCFWNLFGESLGVLWIGRREGSISCRHSCRVAEGRRCDYGLGWPGRRWSYIGSLCSITLLVTISILQCLRRQTIIIYRDFSIACFSTCEDRWGTSMNFWVSTGLSCTSAELEKLKYKEFYFCLLRKRLNGY